MTATRDDVRRRQRLAWAMKDPRRALEGGWVEDPKFCALFLDGCDQLAFVRPSQVLRIARRAVEIADAHGDPHLLYRSHCVLAHAYIARRDLYWARKTLDEVRERALACCPRCRSEHFQRFGDLLMEQRRLDESRVVLDRALEESRALDDDVRGRIHSVRGITHHLLGNRDRALADAGSTLELVDLSSPRGFFVDTPAFITIYVAGGDPRHDLLGGELLAAFDQRIQGERGWGDWLTRRIWAGAQLKARLGDFRGALPMFRRAYTRLLADGLGREAVAAGLDLGQLLCRGDDLPWGRNAETATQVMKRCRDRRPDLAAAHRDGLAEVLKVLDKYPESAFDAMVALRRSFIAPVPGVMVERIGRRASRG